MSAYGPLSRTQMVPNQVPSQKDIEWLREECETLRRFIVTLEYKMARLEQAQQLKENPVDQLIASVQQAAPVDLVEKR